MDLELLRTERMKRGITQEKLAKCLGFKDKSSYCLIEKGRTSVSVDTANQIAIHLGLSKDVAYKMIFINLIAKFIWDVMDLYLYVKIV